MVRCIQDHGYLNQRPSSLANGITRRKKYNNCVFRYPAGRRPGRMTETVIPDTGRVLLTEIIPTEREGDRRRYQKKKPAHTVRAKTVPQGGVTRTRKAIRDFSSDGYPSSHQILFVGNRPRALEHHRQQLNLVSFSPIFSKYRSLT